MNVSTRFLLPLVAVTSASQIFALFRLPCPLSPVIFSMDDKISETVCIMLCEQGRISRGLGQQNSRNMRFFVGVVFLLVSATLLFILMIIPTRIKRQVEEAKFRTIHRAPIRLIPNPTWVPFRPPALTAVPSAHLGSPFRRSAVQRTLFLSHCRQVPPWPAVINRGVGDTSSPRSSQGSMATAPRSRTPS